MKLWEKNFKVNEEIERFTVGRDREMDLYLAKYDVLGSMAHITMLESIGLAVPQITLLMHELNARGIKVNNGIYTEDAAVEEIARLLI